MSVSGKFLFLFIAIIALQEICAWPHFNIWKWKNLGYEINKASDDAEKDVRKDLLNVKNNIWKDTNKLIMKTKGDAAITMCIINTQKEFLNGVDEISVTARNCIEQIRDEANAVEDDKYDPRELNSMKNEMKNKVKSCRNSAKENFKASQKVFNAKIVGCFIPQQSPPVDEDIEDIDSSRSF